MDYYNKKFIIPYLFIAGFIFYLLAAVLDSIFIVALQQDEDWCLESIDIEMEGRLTNSYETECVRFKNDFAMLKHYHNQKMVSRNKYLIFIEYIVAFLITTLFFYFIPKWKGRLGNLQRSDMIFIILMIAFCISIIIPLILDWILPAPVKWFPQIFKDINDAQVKEAIRKLR